MYALRKIKPSAKKQDELHLQSIHHDFHHFHSNLHPNLSDFLYLNMCHRNLMYGANQIELNMRPIQSQNHLMMTHNFCHTVRSSLPYTIFRTTLAILLLKFQDRRPDLQVTFSENLFFDFPLCSNKLLGHYMIAAMSRVTVS